jgi:hypothetical protein
MYRMEPFLVVILPVVIKQRIIYGHDAISEHGITNWRNLF